MMQNRVLMLQALESSQKNQVNHSERPTFDERQKNQQDKAKVEKSNRCLRPMHLKKNCPAKDSKRHKCGKTWPLAKSV